MDLVFHCAPGLIVGATLAALGHHINEWQTWVALLVLIAALSIAEERGAREHRPKPRRRYTSRIAAPD